MHKHHTREQAPAMRRRSLTTAIALTLALGIAGPTFAQDAAPAAATPQGPAADQAQPTELDVVTVTANKREENIREVAVAITKIDAQQIEDYNVTQITDFAYFVPGFQVQSYGSPGQTQVSMRGIAALSPGSTIGTYVDETPVGSNSLYQQATLYQLDLLPYDVESIEVLRGPQGTLYGAGAMGGLIKYTMKKPDATQSEYRVGVGASSTDGADDWGVNYRVGMNIPLVKDSLALRASYASNDIAGYVDNLVNAEEDINDGDQTSARASLMWSNEDLSVLLTAMRQTIDSDNNATVALVPGTEGRVDGLSNYVVVDEPFEKDVDHYALTVEWDAGFADFISATSYADTRTYLVNDLTYVFGEYPLVVGAAPGSTYLEQTLQLDQFTQEFRLQSKTGGALEWLLGAFYSKEDGDNHQFIPLNQMDGSPLPPELSFLSVLGELFIPSTYEETAVFANGSFKFNDWFKLGAGVRFSQNDQEFTQFVPRGLLIEPGTAVNTSSEDVFTWSITPQFQITPDTMVYAKAATGYQPGGPNVVAPGLPSQVDSSMLTSYEVGLKTGFADQRVLLDLTAYKIDWEDIQVASEVNGISGLVNGGEATSRGIEASVSYRPVDGVTLGLNGAYNDAEIDEDFPLIVVTQVIDEAGTTIRADVNTGLAGDAMPYVPDLTWALTADFFVPLSNGWSLSAGGAFRWVDERANATTYREVIYLVNPPVGEIQRTVNVPLVIDSYGAMDLYASVSNDNWTFRTYVKNATDTRAYTLMDDVTSQVTGATHHTSASPLQPRMIGFEVDYRF